MRFGAEQGSGSTFSGAGLALVDRHGAEGLSSSSRCEEKASGAPERSVKRTKMTDPDAASRSTGSGHRWSSLLRSPLSRTRVRFPREPAACWLPRAEDFAQETLKTFIESAARFEGRSHVCTWLFGILYRKVAEARRG